MKVYIVTEEDRGMGEFVIGVYASEEKAKDVASKSSHYFIMESWFHPDGEEVEE